MSDGPSMSALSCYIAVRTLKVLDLHHCDIDSKFEPSYIQLRSESLNYVKTLKQLPKFFKRDTVMAVRQDCIIIFSMCETRAELYFFAFMLVQMYRNNRNLYSKVLVLFMTFFSRLNR